MYANVVNELLTLRLTCTWGVDVGEEGESTIYTKVWGSCLSVFVAVAERARESLFSGTSKGQAWRSIQDLLHADSLWWRRGCSIKLYRYKVQNDWKMLIYSTVITVSIISVTRLAPCWLGREEKTISFKIWDIKPCWASAAIFVLQKYKLDCATK
jgi:hypothetical protein